MCGYKPFDCEDDDDLNQKIKNGEFIFPETEWEHISDEAKDLIIKLLDIDPETRLDNEGILSHPWIQATQDMEGSDEDTDSEMSMEEDLSNKESYDMEGMEMVDAL